MGLNSIVFVVCSVIGYLLGRFLPQGPWAAYVSILISYHLYLAWLVYAAEEKAGVALPVGHTIITHLAFLLVVVGFAYARHHIPFFGLIRLFVPALAPFERMWLFGESAKKKEEVPDSAAAAESEALSAQDAIMSATAEDNEAWIQYLSTRDSRLRRPGITVKEEYGRWMIARVNRRSSASKDEKPA